LSRAFQENHMYRLSDREMTSQRHSRDKTGEGYPQFLDKKS